MTQRPDMLRLSLGADSDRHKATLRRLVAALGFGENISELVRWLAETADAAFEETAALLKAAGSVASGGDEWTTLATMTELLPALKVEVDWEKVEAVRANTHARR